MRILLLEADGRERQACASRLAADGDTVEEVSTVAATRAALAAAPFDCLVLDRLDLALLEEVGGLPMRPRVLILSAGGTGHARARALERGADDVMAKPVHLPEMALRVRNLLRTAPPRGRTIELGRVVILRDHRDVTVDGTTIHLTPVQYAIVEQLALRAEQVVTRDILIQRCWVEAGLWHGAPALGSQISRLRSLFAGALVFEAVYGVGYRMRVPEQ